MTVVAITATIDRRSILAACKKGKTMNALTSQTVQIEKSGAKLTTQNKEIAAPGAHQVRIKIEACGVCHSDSMPIEGHFPGQIYPVIPGHEIVGTVESVGAEVRRLKAGMRVGVGWYAGHCGDCGSCRGGDFVTCQEMLIPGITTNGGYAQYGIFNEDACAMVPEKIVSAEAAPLLCAGVTTFNALRNSGLKAGDTVGILGIGGLGHLGIQFASKMGYRTVAIARGKDKEAFAKELGAHEYIDSQDAGAVEQLKAMGGAKVILCTVVSAKAMTPWIDALTVDGTLLVVGASAEPLEIPGLALIGARRSVKGWPSGTALDSEDCLRFSALHGIRPMIEVFALKDAEKAYEHMMSGKARFRAVLEIK